MARMARRRCPCPLLAGSRPPSGPCAVGLSGSGPARAAAGWAAGPRAAARTCAAGLCGRRPPACARRSGRPRPDQAPRRPLDRPAVGERPGSPVRFIIGSIGIRGTAVRLRRGMRRRPADGRARGSEGRRGRRLRGRPGGLLGLFHDRPGRRGGLAPVRPGPDRGHRGRPERPAGRRRQLGFRQRQPLALSSAGETCRRRGSNSHSAMCRRPPARNASCTCQLPSPCLRESHCASSGSAPSSVRRSATTSPRRGPGRGISLAAHGRGLRLLSDVAALREDRSLEPPDSLDRDTRRIRDLLNRFPGADSCLDLLGSQGILHFDLVLGEPRELAPCDCPQSVVDRQHEAPAPPRNGENGVTAVFADRDEAQFLHRRPFRSRTLSGGRWARPPASVSYPSVNAVYGRTLCRYLGSRHESGRSKAIWPAPCPACPEFASAFLRPAGAGTLARGRAQPVCRAPPPVRPGRLQTVPGPRPAGAGCPPDDQAPRPVRPGCPAGQQARPPAGHRGAPHRPVRTVRRRDRRHPALRPRRDPRPRAGRPARG